MFSNVKNEVQSADKHEQKCLLLNGFLLFLDFIGLWGSMPNDFISDSKINQC